MTSRPAPPEHKLVCPACGVQHDARDVPGVPELLQAREDTVAALEAALVSSRATINRLKAEAEHRRLTHAHREAAEQVFQYWKARLMPKAREFSGSRFDAVAARLSAGATVDEIKRAIDGAFVMPYVTASGRSAKGTLKQRMVELELICRSEAHVQRFGSYAPPPVEAVVSDEKLGEWQKALEPLVDRLRDLRGWEPSVIRKLGLGLDGNRVVFPIRAEGGVVSGLVRYYPNPTRRRGSKSVAEGMRDLFPRPEDFDGTVWLVEGEPDAVAANSIGLSAVAVPGVATWKDGWTDRFAQFDQVVVCFDCDEEGRAAALKRADALRAVTRVNVVDLDRGRSDGFDLGDVVKQQGRMAASALKALAWPRRNGNRPPPVRRPGEDPVEIVLAALEARELRVKGHAPKWTALCPAHEDRNPSLSIGIGDDGRVLLTCHTGCKPEAVLEALGLAWKDAFPDG